MRNSHKRSAHEHFAAIGIAIVLVAATFVGINQSGLLTADILQGDNVIAAGDVSYRAEGSIVTVMSEKTFQDVTSLTFMVVYNPESVKIDGEKISTEYDYTSSSGKDGVMHVTLFLTEMVEGGKELVKIPFEGEANDITISDATMLFNEGTMDGLAIKKQ